jgi:hypothetical protein
VARNETSCSRHVREYEYRSEFSISDYFTSGKKQKNFGGAYCGGHAKAICDGLTENNHKAINSSGEGSESTRLLDKLI